MFKLHQELLRLRMESAVLRCSQGLPPGDAVQRFAFIESHRRAWPVAMMCRVLGVSCSGYYAWRNRPPSRWVERRRQLSRQIKDVFQKSRGTYGSPRIHAELAARGLHCAQKSVAKIMRSEGLRATARKTFHTTTDSNHSWPVAENLLGRNFRASRPNTIWVSDLTAIPTTEGWLYLATILDLFSRRAVGWSLGNRRTCQLVSSALQMALIERRPPAGLIHHSDQGSQYACHDFQNLLAHHQIVCSMSRKGNCWDNAVMESFFGTLTQELLERHHFTTRAEAQEAIVDYIANFYNLHRRHSTLDYLTPAEYETQHAGTVSG